MGFKRRMTSEEHLLAAYLIQKIDLLSNELNSVLSGALKSTQFKKGLGWTLTGYGTSYLKLTLEDNWYRDGAKSLLPLFTGSPYYGGPLPKLIEDAFTSPQRELDVLINSYRSSIDSYE